MFRQTALILTLTLLGSAQVHAILNAKGDSLRRRGGEHIKSSHANTKLAKFDQIRFCRLPNIRHAQAQQSISATGIQNGFSAKGKKKHSNNVTTMSTPARTL